jgi:hypothetical protein
MSNGKIRTSHDVSFAEKAIELKRNKDVWEVIDFLLKRWMSDSPDEVQAFKVHIDNTRDDQIDKKFGQTRDKTMDRRLVVVFPYELQRMIRALYHADELKLDKQFFDEFARRFPAFRIPERM